MPVLYSHRGLHKEGESTENTMEAFDAAIRAGIGIELDVRLTKDGILVVFHDESLKRVCGLDKKIASMSYSELKGIRPGLSNSGIPLLADVLDMVGGRVPLLIEIKPEGGWKRITRVLSQVMSGYAGEYMIQSFHPLAVRLYKKYHRDIPCGILSYDMIGSRKKVNIFKKIFVTYMPLNPFIRPDFISYNYKQKDRPVLKRQLNAGRQVYAWTLRSLEEYERVKDEFAACIFEGFDPSENENDKLIVKQTNYR